MAYQTAPNVICPALLPGFVGWSFGSRNDDIPTSRLQVTSVAISGSNVATLGVTLLEGAIPAVGSLISVQGTQTATSGGAPNFNVTNVAIASVTINSTTGIGTLTFALTSTTIATTPDSGMAFVPVPIVQVTLPGTAAAGQQFAVASGNLSSGGQRGITWFTYFGGAPSTVTMNLQGSDVDADGEYTTIDTSTVATGESRSLANVNYQFYRIKAASTGGSSPTVAAGIMVR